MRIYYLKCFVKLFTEMLAVRMLMIESGSKSTKYSRPRILPLRFSPSFESVATVQTKNQPQGLAFSLKVRRDRGSSTLLCDININMQPEINEADGHLAPLKKVTPLSKYLAMALFIILPFLGGWIGYMYAPEKVVEAILEENDTDVSSLALPEGVGARESLVLLWKEGLTGIVGIDSNSLGVAEKIRSQLPNSNGFYGYNKVRYLTATGDHLVFLADGNGSDVHLVFYDVTNNTWGSHFVRKAGLRGLLYFYSGYGDEAKLFSFNEESNTIFNLSDLPNISERNASELPVLDEYLHENIYIDKSISTFEQKISPTFVFDADTGLEYWKYNFETNSFVLEDI